MSKSNARPLVLIADDDPNTLDYWDEYLIRFGVETVSAMSLDELNRVFRELSDGIAVIILDGCIPGANLNTLEFIRAARASGFTSPIIAASSSRMYRQQMVRQGCSHQADKVDARMLAVQLLMRGR